MKRATETRFEPRPFAVLAVVLTTLAGCDEALIAGNSSSDASGSEAQTDSNKTELFPEVASGSQRDVEAPDVFEATEAGLWDGRPSLGGIWVAHPDATQPERVAIKNTANGKTVTGALFRRERNLPGPALQVSSAAAEKLGMLAGSPTRLQVVALRRETIEPVTQPEAETEEQATPEAVAQETPDNKEIEEPTEAKAEPEDKPAKRKWWQKKAPEESGIAAAGVAAGAAASVAASSDETAASVDAAAPVSTTTNLSDPTVAPPPDKPKKRKWWQKKDPNEITETPLDPIAGAAAAIEASDPTPVAAAAPEPVASNLTKPYVQIGTFSVESNANSAADKVRRNGIKAEVVEQDSNGKAIWRVLVGPAMTRAERRAILGDMKDLGFADAYIVKN